MVMRTLCVGFIWTSVSALDLAYLTKISVRLL